MSKSLIRKLTAFSAGATTQEQASVKTYDIITRDMVAYNPPIVRFSAARLEVTTTSEVLSCSLIEDSYDSRMYPIKVKRHIAEDEAKTLFLVSSTVQGPKVIRIGDKVITSEIPTSFPPRSVRVEAVITGINFNGELLLNTELSYPVSMQYQVKNPSEVQKIILKCSDLL